MNPPDAFRVPWERRVLWSVMLLALVVVAIVASFARRPLEEAWLLRRLESEVSEDGAEKFATLDELLRLESRGLVPLLFDRVAGDLVPPDHDSYICEGGFRTMSPWCSRAVEVLEQQAPAHLDLLARQSEALDPESRAWAVYLIGSAGPAARRLVPRLRASLCDADETVRREAAWALGAVARDSVRLREELRGFLLQSSGGLCERRGLVGAFLWMVRIARVDRDGAADGTESSESVSESVPDPVVDGFPRGTDERRSGAVALAAVAALARAAAAQDVVSSDAAVALVSLGATGRDLPDAVRRAIEQGIDQVLAHPGDVREALVRALADRPISVPQAVPRFRAIAASPDSGIRRSAASWLAEQEPGPVTIDILSGLVVDPEKDVREAAAAGLAEMEEAGWDVILSLSEERQRALAPLLTGRFETLAVSGWQEHEQGAAEREIDRIVRLAGAPGAVVPSLKRLSIEADDDVAFAALAALERIRVQNERSASADRNHSGP